MKINIGGQIVTDAVGEFYSMFGIQTAYPKQVKQALDQADGEGVVVEINSQGGYVTAGYEIYNALKEYKGSVTANVVYAASAATIVACAADKTYISEAGLFMIHNCAATSSGDYREMENQADALRQFNEGILNVYEAKTGKSRDELQALMDKETYMGPARAIELGFVDGYIPRDNKEPVEITDADRMMQFVASATSTSNIISEDEAIKALAEIRSQQAMADTKAEDKGIEPVSIENNVNNAKGGNSMTLEEVLNEHPEIQSAIDEQIAKAKADGMAQGVSDERARMQSLDAIANTVPAEMLKDAKYGENPVDGKELAYQAMVNGQQAAKDYMQNAVEDSKDSGVDNVGVGEADAGEPENIDEADASFMAGYINKKKGEAK